jgi:MerR family transcriptional regulator, copper efflux regulator
MWFCFSLKLSNHAFAPFLLIIPPLYSVSLFRLLCTTKGKGLGFTLGEIKQLLDEWGGGEISKRDLIEIVERKIKEVVKKKQQLESIETYLVNKLSKLNQ